MWIILFLLGQLSSLDSLFIRASTGEIKYLHWNKSARDSFINLGEKAIPYLIDKLDTDNAREQHTLIDIFKKIKTKAVKSLISKAEEDNRLAIYILGEIGDTLALLPLIDLLDSDKSGIRANCLLALGKIGDQRATSKIIPYLQDTILTVRRSASIALSKLGDPVSTNALIGALFDSNRSVRFSASKGLIRLRRIGSKALNPLLKVLPNASPPTNYLIIYTLGEMKNKKAISKLKPSLKSDDPKVRAFTVEALGKLGDYKTIKKLRKKENNQFVKDKIREALK
ncbi:HEAT repeat domain-containing protein [candidate division WOR-3 bacterium]|nr:HEAT repeat domain-containing protein [candidate division WOR-3 bacterium]